MEARTILEPRDLQYLGTNIWNIANPLNSAPPDDFT
jgi:hypothetical protein